jgi:hypothetical protein
MPDTQSALLEKLYLEHRAHARHIEILRSGMLGTINALGGAVLAFATDGGIVRSDWPLGLTVIFLGLFGALFAAKLHEKLRLEMKLAIAALAAWEGSVGGPPASAFYAEVKALHAARHPIMERVKMVSLWLALAILLSTTGVALTIVAVSNDSCLTTDQRQLTTEAA